MWGQLKEAGGDPGDACPGWEPRRDLRPGISARRCASEGEGAAIGSGLSAGGVNLASGAHGQRKGGARAR